MRWRAITGSLVIALVVAGGLTSATLTAFAPRVVPVSAVTPVPADAQPVIVEKVLSGDTVIVRLETSGPLLPRLGPVTARLIGVDSPNFGIIDECYAEDSQARLAELLPVGSLAWLKTDEQAQDVGGRWLTYAWAADGRFVNYLLAIDGFVEDDRNPPNEKYATEISGAVASAASRFSGLWGQCF